MRLIMRDEFWVSQCEHCQGLEASIGADVWGVAAKSKLGPMWRLHSNIAGSFKVLDPPWIHNSAFGSQSSPYRPIVCCYAFRVCMLKDFMVPKWPFSFPELRTPRITLLRTSWFIFSPPSYSSSSESSDPLEKSLFVALLQPTVQIACALWKLQPKPWVDAMGQTCHSLMSTHVDSLPEESFKHVRHAERCRFIFKRRIGWGRLWAGLVATYFESQRKAGPAASSASAGSLQIFFFLIWQNV